MYKEAKPSKQGVCAAARSRLQTWRSGVFSSGFLRTPRKMMKASSGIFASVIAFSTAALSSSSSPLPPPVSPEARNGSQPHRERFEPRFDGLRFIETLVTAHR